MTLHRDTDPETVIEPGASPAGAAVTAVAAARPAPGPGSETDVAVTPDELRRLCETALAAAGGSPRTAASLAAATVDAERRGKPQVGVLHLLDYLEALERGSLDGSAEPEVVRERPAAILVDAGGGTAQAAFDLVRDRLVEQARAFGVSMLSVTDSFTTGELAHYTATIAEHGLVALAGANSPALMTLYDAREAVAGTNPLAFSLPHPDGPRSFDQASSATAWVKIRDAADRGETIPDGWALDPDGEPTTDAGAAIAGALLPFGGAKGSNIAIMVEMLAALGGGRFSLDAPPFDSGDEGPGVGLFLIAIDPEAFDPGYGTRVEEHLARLREQHGVSFGRRRPTDAIRLSADAYRALRDSRVEMREH